MDVRHSYKERTYVSEVFDTPHEQNILLRKFLLGYTQQQTYLMFNEN
jgi:hypothetical protein